MSKTKPHLDEWQNFTVRHGRIKVAEQARWLDKMPWAGRHASVPNDDLAPERRRCICPGSAFPERRGACLIAATQEDLLCDECRIWCVAVDGNGKFHQFATLTPGASR